MTEAVIRATYADFKLIKSRGVVQLVFEVPIHESGRALDVAGGMPESAKERWFAIARLTEEASQAPRQVSPQLAPAGAPKSYAQRIALLCKEGRFWRFLEERHKFPVVTEDDAACAVKDICGVASRREIVDGTDPGKRWRRISADYDAWLMEPA